MNFMPYNEISNKLENLFIILKFRNIWFIQPKEFSYTLEEFENGLFLSETIAG